MKIGNESEDRKVTRFALLYKGRDDKNECPKLFGTGILSVP